MNAFEKLSLAAWHSASGLNSLLSHYSENRASASSEISNIFQNALQDQTTHPDQKISLIGRSIQVIRNSLTSPPQSLFQQIFSSCSRLVFGSSQQTEANEILNVLDQAETQLQALSQNPPLSNNPKSHLEALTLFMSEFQRRFGVKPDAMKGAEIFDFIEMGRRVWESSNVQTQPLDERYAKFAELMEEDAIGSHILIVEQPGTPTLFETVSQRVGGIAKPADPYTKISTKLEERVSSHYGKVGDEIHHHIRGNLFSEMLMHHGTVGFKERNVVLQGGKAAYWTQLNETEKAGAAETRVTWRQKESYPDGPDWKSWMLHRTVDFLLYAFLKNVAKVDRPQVAKHKLVHAEGRTGVRGLPDTKPVVIFPHSQASLITSHL